MVEVEGSARVWVEVTMAALRAKERRAVASFLARTPSGQYTVEVACKRIDPDEPDDKIPSPHRHSTRWQFVTRVDVSGVQRTKAPAQDTVLASLLLGVHAGVEALFHAREGLRAPLASLTGRITLECWRGGEVCGVPWLVRKDRWLSLHTALERF